jgi:hypothetical protein
VGRNAAFGWIGSAYAGKGLLPGTISPTAEVNSVLPPSVPVLTPNSYRMVLVAVVLGLVLGAGAVGMTWFMHGNSLSAMQLPTTDAGTDAAAACATLDSVPALASPAFARQSPQGVPDGVFRLAGAASLAQAAEAEDVHYKSLSDALNRANQVVGGMGDTHDIAAVTALANARTACVNH